MFKIFLKQAVDFSGLSRSAGRVDLYCKNTLEAGEERNTLFSEKIRSDQKKGVRSLHRWNQMSAFQQRKQLLRRHIQDPGLLAAGYRIKKCKLPVLKLQNSFFDGVLCNQLMLLGANGQRLHLSDGNGDAFGRYLLGYLCVGSDGALRFEEAAQLITDDYEVFSRNDAGYGEEQSLGYFDTLMKNSYEILSPLNRLTAEREMTSHWNRRHSATLRSRSILARSRTHVRTEVSCRSMALPLYRRRWRRSTQCAITAWTIRTAQCSCSARTMGAQFAPRRK